MLFFPQLEYKLSTILTLDRAKDMICGFFGFSGWSNLHQKLNLLIDLNNFINTL